MEFDIGVKNIAPVLIHKMNMDDRDPKDSAQYLNVSFKTAKNVGQVSTSEWRLHLLHTKYAY